MEDFAFTTVEYLEYFGTCKLLIWKWLLLSYIFLESELYKLPWKNKIYKKLCVVTFVFSLFIARTKTNILLLKKLTKGRWDNILILKLSDTDTDIF